VGEGGHQILLVEDDDELRDVLVVLFEMNGWEVVAAANGDDALGHLREGLRPCMIVFDLVMPGKGGWEFRAAQLADPALAPIPAVAISAAVQGPTMQRVLQVEDFLPKPIDVDRLLACVERHCPRSAAPQTGAPVSRRPRA